MILPSIWSGITTSPFTEEHLRFRTSVRDLLAPHHDARSADEWERDRCVPVSFFKELGAAGLFEARWHAGRAPGLAHAAILAEELSLLAGGVGLSVGLHNELFVGVLTGAQRSPYAAEIRERALLGEAVGAFASTEQSGGSDIRAIGTAARRTAGGWAIAGQKRFTSNLATATHAVVLATAVDASLPLAFLVDLQAEGVQIDGYYQTLGVRSCSTGQLTLDTVVAGDALLGGLTSSFMLVKQALQGERLSAAVQSLTAANAALRLAGAFARSRQLHGQQLIDNDAARQRLGAAMADVIAGIALASSVLTMATAGRDTTRQTAALKLAAARIADEAVDAAVQTFGGRGYIEPFPLERYLRDVRLARIGGGTDEVMADIVTGVLDRSEATYDDWLRDLEQGAWCR